MHNQREAETSGGDRASAFRQTQRLLGAYPFASATPSTHVARHLNNLSLTGTPPSYIHPAYYSTPAAYGHSSTYQNELAHISTMNVPHGGYERAYWDASRNDVFRMMPDHSMSECYSGSCYERNALSADSSYQLAPFAQSVIQHEAPYNAYPTPPPASISFSSSSSSLANALGSPTPRKTEPSLQEPSGPKTNLNDSACFFDNFLNERLKELPKERWSQTILPHLSSSTQERRLSTPVSKRSGSVAESPLSWDTQHSSPKKRKLVEVVIETPSKQSSANKSRSSTLPASDTSFRQEGQKPMTPSRAPRMQVYVEITPSKSLATPVRSHASAYASSPDLGGYGAEEGNHYPLQKQGVRSSGKRTGERDDRVPLEKFLNLTDEIFEADDNISPDGEISALPTNFFSHHSTDPAKPLLHPVVILRLTKAIGKVARPTKRLRLASAQWESVTPGSPRKAGGMADVEVQTLSRLLKLLERSVQAGEDLDPFRSTSLTGVGSSGLPGKPGAMHEPSGTRSGHSEVDPAETTMTLADEDFDKLERSLETVRESVLAANCCFALLTSDRLAKQLFSEDLISSCLTVIKNSLTKIIYPFVEAPSLDTREFSSLLLHVLNRPPEGAQLFDLTNHRHLIGDIFQVMSSVFPRINSLICSDGLSMPESIIIPAVYIAIGPFFVIEAIPDGEAKVKRDAAASIILDTLGSSGMRGLRLQALSLVRSIYAYHEDQRSWIIEEILTSLVRLSDSKQKAGVFRLRDGRSIRTVSALLLQLVQTSAHSVRVEAHRLKKMRQQRLALKRQESNSGIQQESSTEQLVIEEAGLYSTGLDAPTKAAKSIVMFLTQRSGRGKSTKNTNELEYRVILDNLINDLLVVLFWTEWPAASLVLSVACKYMISSLDDVKSSNNDNNASKALALDHLGIIAARLRANALKWSKPDNDASTNAGVMAIKSLDDLVATWDKEGLGNLISIHQDVSSHLSKRSAEDHAFESARELHAVMWGQELASAFIQLNNLLTDQNEVNLDPVTTCKYAAFMSKIKSALQDVWKDAPTDVFDNTTQDEIDRADNLSEQLGTTQALKNAFDPILNVIILALDAPAVFVRTKALRALSHILTVDSSVLTKSNVRRAIESHLLDSSPQVRDAAVELIGKYIVDSPVVAGDYYQKIAERIADTGLGVRKRVIRLLKSFYSVTNSLDRKIDTCSKLVLRMLDEDDTVKDLSIKTLEELWFSNGPLTAQANRGVTLETVSVVMGVCSVFKDRHSPLEEMLCRIVNGKEGSDDSTPSSVQCRFKEIYDVMIEGLVDASDYVNFTIINCIRAIYLFTSAFPSVLTGPKASVLLPYLKNSASNEDVVASDYILKIYRASIPNMSKTSVKFGNDLQSILQPMVLKPNIHGTSLQEVVACLCVVVQHLTHDSARIVALLKSCIGTARLRQFITRPSNSLAPNDSRTLQILVMIVSLLGEHFKFDRLRSESADLSTQLDAISKGPIIDHIYMCLLQLYERYTDSNIRGRLLACLGFLFRAQPTLMTLDSSATIMDAIFASSEDDNRARLLKIMQEFLASESTKHSVQQIAANKPTRAKSSPGINMEELVGNTHGFAESGVSSAVVQRYLSQILDAALSPFSHVQASAVDILSFTVKQGLAHPLLSFPVIVALETAPVSSLSTRAVALHTILHHKHASLLNSGFIAACRKSFDYQCKLTSTEAGESKVRGYRMQLGPVALLGRWYALVREKRATRQEFLRSILKVFELRDVGKTDDDTVQFSRYMAENFASFDYRTQEEVLTVLKTLTRELAETGAQLVERIAPGNLLAQLRSQDREIGDDQAQIAESSSLLRPDLASLPVGEQIFSARSTCIVGMIMLLKSYLKSTYGLSEEKCQKFVLGKKSAIGDRPAVRRRDIGISWERMPFAAKAIRKIADVQAQRATFLEIWNEDGATAEPDGEEWE
ncbi:SCC2 [Sanghuangporus weigelae]